MVVLHVPEVLRDKLGSDGAKALVDLLNDASAPLRDDVLTIVEERFRRHLSEELSLVRQEMALFRREIAREFAQVRQEIAREFIRARQEIADVRVDVASVESRLTWRLFYFWSAHLVAIAGLLVAFFKFFG